MAKILKLPPPIKVGTPVSIEHCGEKIHGRVIEDRGPIGVGGRRLYAVCFHATVIELPASELTPNE